MESLKIENQQEKYVAISNKIKKFERAKTLGRELLMSKSSLPTKSDYEFVESFEKIHNLKKVNTGSKLSEYEEKIKNLSRNPVKNTLKIDFNTLRSVFLDLYEVRYHNYVLNNDTSLNLNTVLYYFSLDKRFLDSPRLITELNFGGKIKKLKPSSKKGLMIIGSYGVSKSSSMEVIRLIYYKLSQKGFNTSNNLFRSYSCNEVVDIFETCKTTEEKARFNKDMTRGVVHFGDLKTEREASNYGKANLMKEIIEKRYDNGLKTHVDMNFRNGNDGDVEDAIMELGEKYGSRFFDRVFEMFNIIVFEGKSFRGLF